MLVKYAEVVYLVLLRASCDAALDCSCHSLRKYFNFENEIE